MSAEQVTAPKRKEPPDEPGIFYYHPHEVYKLDANEFFVVSIYKVQDTALGLYGAILDGHYPPLLHNPISAFPAGDWWGPLPRPARE